MLGVQCDSGDCPPGRYSLYGSAQRGQVICPGPHSHSSDGAGFELGSWASLSLGYNSAFENSIEIKQKNLSSSLK